MLAFLLFVLSASAAVAQTRWNIQLASNQRATSTLSVQNLCLAAHQFSLTPSADMSWLGFIREPRVQLAPGETGVVDVRLDTTDLDAGVYEGRISVHCTNCGSEPGCAPQSIEARMKVTWAAAQLEQVQPDLFVAQQLLVILPLAADREIGRIALDLETRYQLRQIKSFQLRSISRAAVLFGILDPNLTVAQSISRIQEETGVLYAQPNFIYHTDSAQAATNYNDPLSPLQYGPRMLRAEEVHKHSTGRGVKIAIIDTGIDYDHADLKGRVIDRANFVDGDGNFSTDIHGTLIAGVIAARSNNGIGIYGVAPGASLIAIKAFKPRNQNSIEADGSSQTLAQGLDHAIARGARVVNLSIGGPREPLVSQLVRAAFESGIVLVAAAGNNGPRASPVYPAELDQVVAVTAIDSRYQIYSAANRGRAIDLAAPGVEIISTLPGNKFNAFSGTSIAVPHVSAAVALLLQRNPKLSVVEIKTLLEGTARDLGPKGKDTEFGSGAVDVCEALEKVMANVKICR